METSIIIPAYNSEEFLSESLESALSQTYDDYEIIVVDDGSTDQTQAIIEQYRQRYPEKIRYIYQDNGGMAVARNTAIQYARGEFIAFLDSDDKWLPHRLEASVRAIKQSPDIGLVHANITCINEQGKETDTPFREVRYLSGAIYKHLFLRQAQIACPTVIVRKCCLDQVGLFDENLTRLGCEDRDLWLRIAREYRIEYIDEVISYYRIREGSLSRNRAKMMQGRLYVINKYCPPGKDGRLRRTALAQIYRDLGDEFLLEHNFANAREQYWKAITTQPMEHWAWINLMKSLLKVKV